MKRFLQKYWLTFTGVVLGVIGGYIYYYFWGCVNGCPIKSNAWKMIIYGALLGGLFFNMLQDFLQRKRKNSRD